MMSIPASDMLLANACKLLGPLGHCTPRLKQVASGQLCTDLEARAVVFKMIHSILIDRAGSYPGEVPCPAIRRSDPNSGSTRAQVCRDSFFNSGARSWI
jgi:hypothetical protein